MPNSINNKNKKRQQRTLVKLINLLQQHSILKHIEVSSLRNLTGRDWLSCLKQQVSLQSLNLSGCPSIESEPVVDFLTNGGSVSLRHLNLFACVRLGPTVVRTIADHSFNLESLWLGACSQTIKSPDIEWLLFKLDGLKHLNLQALKHLKDPLLGLLPSSLRSINLASCERLRLESGETAMIDDLRSEMELQQNTSWIHTSNSRFKLEHLVLDSIGSPRRGLSPGVLAFFSFGRCLREVHLQGCEQVADWEVQVLAQTCGKTLIVFQMRASSIGNASLIALATHCTTLKDVDITACYRIDDEGVLALCEMKSMVVVDNNANSSNKRRFRCPPLKSLKIGYLPGITDATVSAISKLEGLHVLDIRECQRVTSSTLCKTISRLPELIDVNATGIVSYSTMLRQCGTSLAGLQFVNNRSVSGVRVQHNCCSVRDHAQRLNKSVPLQWMYHCVDCGLLPTTNRGICACCLTKCHEGHATFVGSWTRFYCDCPFAIAANECQAIFD
jgi:hypothetical protein